jgi:hypothetical protein
MQQQEMIQEPLATAKASWETPELVKVDVSTGTLNGVNASRDGVGAGSS